MFDVCRHGLIGLLGAAGLIGLLAAAGAMADPSAQARLGAPRPDFTLTESIRQADHALGRFENGQEFRARGAERGGSGQAGVRQNLAALWLYHQVFLVSGENLRTGRTPAAARRAA